MTTTQLTPAQHSILAYAINHTAGKIDWFPDNIKGGARKKVLDGMFNRALITNDGTDWFVAAEGYDALGMPRPGSEKCIGSFEAKMVGRMVDRFLEFGGPCLDRLAGAGIDHVEGQPRDQLAGQPDFLIELFGYNSSFFSCRCFWSLVSSLRYCVLN